MKTKALDCPVRKDCMEFGRCDQCEHGMRYMELRQKLANSAKKVSALYAQNSVLKAGAGLKNAGCPYCTPTCMPPLNWQYELYHAFPDYRFCPMCGRDMRRKEDGSCEHDAD